MRLIFLNPTILQRHLRDNLPLPHNNNKLGFPRPNSLNHSNLHLVGHKHDNRLFIRHPAPLRPPQLQIANRVIIEIAHRFHSQRIEEEEWRGGGCVS